MKDLPASIVNSTLVTDPWEGVELKLLLLKWSGPGISVMENGLI